ncbi:helix-turn-helix domain-containing protein [Dinghuibacter silviterrae]|uniref:Helix-turn-helix protein n=1 Tax=Dinghuibacter silviterrae TaxID=1539049 RepID=A0A4R8DX64_9BACT|nr:helix-turn-helix transcriptional regulator [Dinghuibacter silviterrae]TDX02125.1 helix-turn-helix protein [Dinghuibacter silviterrae]
MPAKQLYRIKTITEYHRLWQLPKPEHPLVSVIDFADITPPFMDGEVNIIFDFYSISLKRAPQVIFKYGQQTSDFDEGVLFFMAPGQVFGFEVDQGITQRPTGWVIQLHPDFLWNTPLARSIRQYEFFDYTVNEALYLSEKEEIMITGIVQSMAQEYRTNIDRFTQSVMVAQLELLLTYADRFYQRQFITRKVANHEVLGRLEDLMSAYFRSGALATEGLPSVAYIAEALHISPGYLTSLLKLLTGRSTQQHLHDKLMELAKEKLTTTHLSVSEIAYELGFEHLQSFSKLFKAQTSLSPMAFRRSFN